MIVSNEFADAFDAIGAAARVAEAPEHFGDAIPGNAELLEPVQIRMDEPDAGSDFKVAFDVIFDPYRVVHLGIREVDQDDRYVIVSTEDWSSDPPRPLLYRCGIHGDTPYVDPIHEPHEV